MLKGSTNVQIMTAAATRPVTVFAMQNADKMEMIPSCMHPVWKTGRHCRVVQSSSAVAQLWYYMHLECTLRVQGPHHQPLDLEHLPFHLYLDKNSSCPSRSPQRPTLRPNRPHRASHSRQSACTTLSKSGTTTRAESFSSRAEAPQSPSSPIRESHRYPRSLQGSAFWTTSPLVPAVQRPPSTFSKQATS